ncbi:UNVERIFIED_ORG: hypothetical protein ABIC81_004301 [Bacillus proteolyticus]
MESAQEVLMILAEMCEKYLLLQEGEGTNYEQ